MKSFLIAFIIYLIIKVFLITNHANAIVNPSCLYDKNTDYGFGYDSDGLNEYGQMSILKFAEDSYCNGYNRRFIYDNLVLNLGAKKLNNYIPGYTCDKSTTFQINCGPGGYNPPSSQDSWKVSSNNISCNSELEFRFINNYTNPTYRCGNTPSIKRI